MKFSDVIMAAALLFVVSILLAGFLFVPFAPLKNSMILVASVISGLIISIAVGYLFAVQIGEESRLRAIGSIVLLATAGVMIFMVGWTANPLVSPALKDMLQSVFSTSTTSGWTDYDWFAYTALAIGLDIIVFVVLSFVGLYVGSMLKPKKS